ncbi:MAG: Lrp/AsnC ligand binding domain-containing protein [Natronomonas sp.]
MASAFIMVKAAAGRAEHLSETIRDIEKVTEASVVAGDFDLIVEAESEDVSDVIHSVATEIRSLDDVLDTKTYVCLA